MHLTRVRINWRHIGSPEALRKVPGYAVIARYDNADSSSYVRTSIQVAAILSMASEHLWVPRLGH